MIEAGLPLSRCLTVLSKQSGRALGRMADQMRIRIDQGATLTEAAQEHPGVFSPLDINLLRAAEVSGDLGQVLLKMAETQENLSRLKKQFVSKMIYPVILLHAGILIPAGVTWFQRGGGPALAQVLGVLMPLYLVVGLALAAYRWGGRLSGFRIVLDTLFYYTPFLGGVVKKVGVARFARTFEALNGAGVSVLQAFPLAAEATGNHVLEQRIKQAEPALSAGQDLALAIIGTGAFSPMVNNMIATGVESGKLDAMLAKVSETTEFDARVSVDRLGKVIPGLIYAAIVFLIVRQIFQMAGQYSGAIDGAIKGRF